MLLIFYETTPTFHLFKKKQNKKKKNPPENSKTCYERWPYTIKGNENKVHDDVQLNNLYDRKAYKVVGGAG